MGAPVTWLTLAVMALATLNIAGCDSTRATRPAPLRASSRSAILVCAERCSREGGYRLIHLVMIRSIKNFNPTGNQRKHVLLSVTYFGLHMSKYIHQMSITQRDEFDQESKFVMVLAPYPGSSAPATTLSRSRGVVQTR